MSEPVFSVGGFSTLRDDSHARRAEALSNLQRRKEAQSKRELTFQKQADHNIVKIASVSLGQWEVEKEKRVKTAFDRIVEKEWYDKYEMDLKAAEQNHINAVPIGVIHRAGMVSNPHFVARANSSRKPDGSEMTTNLSVHTPSTNMFGTYSPFHARSASKNTMHALEWAENVDALDQLGAEGSFVLQDRFLAKVRKDAEAKRKAREFEIFAVKQIEAAQLKARRDAHENALLPSR